MVEAAGIEPASESMVTQVSTCLFCFFISDNETPADGLFIIQSPFFLPQGQEKNLKASLLTDTILETQAISR
jgi:hypothetical protein